MKAIEPVSVWVNGEVKTAVAIKCHISYDDMSSYATFGYALNEEYSMTVPPGPDGEEQPPMTMYQVLTTGTVNISGQDYQDWNDSNDAAYQYVADKLNLVIVVPE